MSNVDDKKPTMNPFEKPKSKKEEAIAKAKKVKSGNLKVKIVEK